jgi:hypothetical protein
VNICFISSGVAVVAKSKSLGLSPRSKSLWKPLIANYDPKTQISKNEDGFSPYSSSHDSELVAIFTEYGIQFL